MLYTHGIFWFNNPNRVNWLEIIYYWWLLLSQRHDCDCITFKMLLIYYWKWHENQWMNNSDSVIHLRSAATDYLFSFIKSIIHWSVFFLL